MYKTVSTSEPSELANGNHVGDLEKDSNEKSKPVNPSRTSTQYLVGLVASLTAAAMGFSMVYSSTLIADINQNPNKDGLSLTQNEASWLGSIWGLGYCFGNLCTGIPLRMFGRKRVLMVGMIPFCLGWLCYALANSVIMLFAGRILTSWAGGFVSGPSQLYLAEISQPDIRGVIGVFVPLLKTLGILASYSLGAVMDFRTLAWVDLALPVLVFVAMLWMPESPKWLVNKKRDTEAAAALRFLRGPDYDFSAELKSMQDTQQTAEKDKIELAILTKGQYLRPVLIAIMLMVFYVLSGVNNVLFFARPIFETAGTSLSGSLSAVIVGSVSFVGYLVSISIIDKCNRRVLLLSSIFTVSVSLIPLGFYFYLKNTGVDVSNIGWLPITSVAVYIFSFAIGLGPLPFVIMGEILPIQVRELGSTIVFSFLSISTFSNAKAMHPLFDLIGEHGAFWFYSAMSAAGFFFIWICVPETKGRSLEEIETLLHKDSIRRRSGKFNHEAVPLESAGQVKV